MWIRSIEVRREYTNFNLWSTRQKAMSDKLNMMF